MPFIPLSPQPAATRRSNKFTTPARSEIVPPHSEGEPVAKLVTPSEPSNDVASIRAAVTNSPLANEQGDPKQVRFGPGNVTESPRQQNRGLVSRRGGRYSSPANRPVLTTTQSEDSGSAVKDEAVAEYKTFRSPSMKRKDEVPCLSNEQRVEKVCSSSESSSPPASTVEANADTADSSNVPRSPRKDETTKVRKQYVHSVGYAYTFCSYSLPSASCYFSQLTEGK